jgi:hypothetical protein
MEDVYSIDDATTEDSIKELQETMMKMDLNDQQHDSGIAYDGVQWTSSGLSQDHTRDSFTHGRRNGFVLQGNLTIESYKLFPVLRSVSFDPFDLSPLFDKLAKRNSSNISIYFVSIYSDAMTIRHYMVMVRERE